MNYKLRERSQSQKSTGNLDSSTEKDKANRFNPYKNITQSPRASLEHSNEVNSQIDRYCKYYSRQQQLDYINRTGCNSVTELLHYLLTNSSPATISQHVYNNCSFSSIKHKQQGNSAEKDQLNEVNQNQQIIEEYGHQEHQYISVPENYRNGINHEPQIIEETEIETDLILPVIHGHQEHQKISVDKDQQNKINQKHQIIEEDQEKPMLSAEEDVEINFMDVNEEKQNISVDDQKPQIITKLQDYKNKDCCVEKYTQNEINGMPLITSEDGGHQKFSVKEDHLNENDQKTQIINEDQKNQNFCVEKDTQNEVNGMPLITDEKLSAREENLIENDHKTDFNKENQKIEDFSSEKDIQIVNNPQNLDKDQHYQHSSPEEAYQLEAIPIPHSIENVRKRLDFSTPEMTDNVFSEEYPEQIENYIVLGPKGTEIDRESYNKINWSSAAAATRQLLQIVFPGDILATHTLSGKPSPAFYGRERPAKLQLNPDKIADIIHCIRSKTKCTEREIRATITTKCADTAKKFKRLEQKQIKSANGSS